MSNGITNRQMFFILLLVLTSYSLLNIAQLTAMHAGRGGWVSILISALIFACAIFIVVRLNNMYPGRVLADYSAEIAGKFVSVIASIVFVLYFLLVCVFLNVSIATNLKLNFLTRTPKLAIMVIGLFFFGYSAHKGITNIARLFEIYGFTFLIIMTATFIIMLTQGDFLEIVPLFNPKDIPNYLGAIRYTILPFLGFEILTVVPFGKQNQKAGKTAFWSMLAIAVFYILAIESAIMILGLESIIFYNDSIVQAIRIAEAPFLERFDILYSTIGFAALTSGITIIYAGAVEYVCRLFKKVKRFIVVILVGGVILVISLLVSDISNFDHIFSDLITVSGVFVAVVIPAALLITAKVKKKHESKTD